MPLTSGLLQGWLDIGTMVILSLLCFIWAGPTLFSFCLLSCTFISLISSGSGRTSNEFQPCSKPCSLAAIFMEHYYTIGIILLLVFAMTWHYIRLRRISLRQIESDYALKQLRFSLNWTQFIFPTIVLGMDFTET